jgi:membrane protease YdiL (CAAX protease family)
LPTWDFLWFVLNPHFKLKKFHREKIWWHEKIIWIFGLMPWDYFLALNLSIGLIFIFNPLNQTFSEQLTYPGVQLFLTLLTIIFSPLYHRLYWRLRK